MKKITAFVIALLLPAFAALTAAADLLGDVNGNGKIDTMDYAMAKRAYLGTYDIKPDELKRGDINGNGRIDTTEYAMIKRHYLGTYTIEGGPESPASEGLEYWFDRTNGAYTVKSIGQCTDKNIVIPASYNGHPVTAINSNAFMSTDIESIVIPEGVTTAGKSVFGGCNKLTRIVVPDSLIYVEADTFDGCAYTMDKNNWDGEVLYIGRHFYKIREYASITDLVIKPGTVSIAANAFRNNRSLKSLEIPDSVCFIGTDAFRETELMNSIARQALDNGEPLESLVLYIGHHLIKKGRIISGEYTVKPGTVCIANGALSFTNINSVVIPASVKGIGQDAFGACQYLETVYYEGSEEEWNRIYMGERLEYTKDGITKQPTEIVFNYKP